MEVKLDLIVARLKECCTFVEKDMVEAVARLRERIRNGFFNASNDTSVKADGTWTVARASSKLEGFFKHLRSIVPTGGQLGIETASLKGLKYASTWNHRRGLERLDPYYMLCGNSGDYALVDELLRLWGRIATHFADPKQSLWNGEYPKGMWFPLIIDGDASITPIIDFKAKLEHIQAPLVCKTTDTNCELIIRKWEGLEESSSLSAMLSQPRPSPSIQKSIRMPSQEASLSAPSPSLRSSSLLHQPPSSFHPPTPLFSPLTPSAFQPPESSTSAVKTAGSQSNTAINSSQPSPLITITASATLHSSQVVPSLPPATLPSNSQATLSLSPDPSSRRTQEWRDSTIRRFSSGALNSGEPTFVAESPPLSSPIASPRVLPLPIPFRVSMINPQSTPPDSSPITPQAAPSSARRPPSHPLSYRDKFQSANSFTSASAFHDLSDTSSQTDENDTDKSDTMEVEEADESLNSFISSNNKRKRLEELYDEEGQHYLFKKREPKGKGPAEDFDLTDEEDSVAVALALHKSKHHEAEDGVGPSRVVNHLPDGQPLMDLSDDEFTMYSMESIDEQTLISQESIAQQIERELQGKTTTKQKILDSQDMVKSTSDSKNRGAANMDSLERGGTMTESRDQATEKIKKHDDVEDKERAGTVLKFADKC
ncbi:hypothetical protein BC829DRAFT_441530 [Chytridium lagenaria]|nr:hypothetical protein BC829DRAFT_441530 [Chytridium lagenaria]